MITLEKHFQAKLTPWLEKYGFTCGGELKISHGNTVPFSKFEEQQLPNLFKVKHGIKVVKLSDALRNLKPFDFLCLKNEPAYVGVMFNIPKNQKEFWFIDIDHVMRIKNSGAKSITKKDCEKMGFKNSF